ncbi:MAG: NAD-dependent epimerase/dehydratase family protein, partial [Bacteroidota bacterium]
VHSAGYMQFNYEKDTFYRLNVEATKNLLGMAKQCGIQRFIYISAAPVVPGSPIIQLREKDASSGLPKALYPKTKAIAERAVLEQNSNRFTTLSLRPPAIWGPNNHHMEEVFERIRSRRWVWLGGGHQILSTIHTDNLAAAVLAALENGRGGEAYFVTDGDQRSMRTSFSAIFAAHGLDPGEREFPLWLASFLANFFELIWRIFSLKSRPPIPPLAIRLMGREFSVVDEKARVELGYKNIISFQEGIEQIRKLNRS